MGRSGNLFCKNDYLIYEMLQNPYYEVRADGTIWTCITVSGRLSVSKLWRQMGSARRGYWTLKYKGKMLQMHRVIYAKFNGQLEPDLVVMHLDNNGYNNSPDNLKLGTQSQNNYHRYRGPDQRKPVMGNKVLTWDIVREIRKRYKEQEGTTYHDLCYAFDISKSHVSQIINNEIWIEGKLYA